MSHPERRIKSIPPRTSLDVLRGGVTVRIGGGSLLGGARRVSRAPTSVETDWSKEVAKHVFQKPPAQEKARPEPLYERERKIEWETEVIEDYNGNGDLGIILQLSGIGLTGAPFATSKHDSPNSRVFYVEIGYENKRAHLFLATTVGGIFKAQIVPAQMDVGPLFQETLDLDVIKYDPASMTASQNNGLVIVGYNPRTRK